MSGFFDVYLTCVLRNRVWGIMTSLLHHMYDIRAQNPQSDVLFCHNFNNPNIPILVLETLPGHFLTLSPTKVRPVLRSAIAVKYLLINYVEVTQI